MANANILSFHGGLNICFSILHYRVFTRIAVVPFERISEVQTLKKSLELKAALQPVLRRAVLSVGKLRDDFREMKEDPLFLSEISPVLGCSALDMRTHLNYALLLYSVGKVCNFCCDCIFSKMWYELQLKFWRTEIEAHLFKTVLHAT